MEEMYDRSIATENIMAKLVVGMNMLILQLLSIEFFNVYLWSQNDFGAQQQLQKETIERYHD